MPLATDDAAGGPEQPFEMRRETGLETARRPQRRVAETLHFGGHVDRRVVAARQLPLHQIPTRPRSMAAHAIDVRSLDM